MANNDNNNNNEIKDGNKEEEVLNVSHNESQIVESFKLNNNNFSEEPKAALNDNQNQNCSISSEQMSEYSARFCGSEDSENIFQQKNSNLSHEVKIKAQEPSQQSQEPQQQPQQQSQEPQQQPQPQQPQQPVQVNLLSSWKELVFVLLAFLALYFVKLECKESEYGDKYTIFSLSFFRCHELNQCGRSQFESKSPRRDEISSTYVTDRECTNLTECDYSTQFESKSPTKDETNLFYITDRECQNFSECSNIQFQIEPPTKTTDRKCQNATICNSDFEYEHKLLTKTSDRVCYPIGPKKENLIDMIRNGTFHQISPFIKEQCQTLQDLLLSSIPKILTEVITDYSKEISESLQTWKLERLEWFISYLNFYSTCNNLDTLLHESMYNKCISCNQEIQRSFDLIKNYYDRVLNKIDQILLDTISNNDLNKLKDLFSILEGKKDIFNKLLQLKHPLFSSNINSFNFYKNASKKLEDGIQVKLKKLNEADLQDAKTKISQTERKKFFSNLFSDFNSIVEMEQLINANLGAQLALNNLILKIKSLENKAKTILHSHVNKKLNRNDASEFQAIYLNLVEISELCNIQYSDFNCLVDLKYFPKKIKEMANENLQNVDINNLKSISSSLSFIQLLTNFLPALKLNEMIADFLENELQPSVVFQLHNLLMEEEDGLGQDLIQKQPIFKNIRTIVRKGKIKNNIDNIVQNYRGEGKHNGWSRRDPLLKHFSTYKTAYNENVEKFGEIESEEKLTKLSSSLIADTKDYFKNYCPNRISPHLFNKKCIPKALAYLSAVWATSFLDKEKKFPLITYLFDPYDAQIFTIFRLLGIDEQELELSNHLTQVKTGEGKSLILALTASMIALMGNEVHIVCYSEYLSSRDERDFDKFFTNLGIKDKVFYRTIDNLAEYIINSKVNVREFIENGFSVRNNSKLNPTQNKYILIDEVDVFFNSDFYGNIYNIGAKVKSPTFKDLALKIWSEKIDSFETISSTPEYQNTLNSFSRYPKELVESATKKMISDFKNFGIHSYIAKNGKIGYRDLDKISFNQFFPYLTLFAYINENKKNPEFPLEEAEALRLSCGKFSYAEIPLQFKAILGVSGTLESLTLTEKEILENRYNIKRITIVPTMFAPTRLDFVENSRKYVKIVDNSTFQIELMESINEGLVNRQTNRKRAVIVVFKDTQSLIEFYNSEQFKNYRAGTKFYTEDSDEEDRHTMSTRTNSGQITFITRSFGRGVDFSCYDSTVNDNGGVQIIQTFFSKEPSEEIQIRGRTNRQGEPGSYYLVLKKEELVGDFGISQENLMECDRSVNCYTKLAEIRGQIYNEICIGKDAKANARKVEHEESMKFLESIYSNDTEAIIKYLIENNDYFKNENNAGRSKKPVHHVLCLDSSGSMQYPDTFPWYQLEEAVKYYLTYLVRNNFLDDVVSFVIYDHKVEKEVIQRSVKQALEEINQLLVFYGGGTEFGVAIEKSHKILNETDLNQYDIKFLFLSDGASSTGNIEIENLGKDLGPKGLKTFVFAFGKNSDTTKLQTMATLHGHGAQYLASDISKTNQDSGTILPELKNAMDILLRT